MKKPISPFVHGLLDYALITSLFIAPKVLKISPNVAKTYYVLGSTLMIYNAVTDHGTSVKPLISFQTHYKIDPYNLLFLTSLLLKEDIRTDKKALLFHSAFISLSLLNHILTDASTNKVGDDFISG